MTDPRDAVGVLDPPPEPEPGGAAPVEPGDGGWDEYRAQRDQLLRLVVDAFVVTACVAFVFWQLHPELLLRNTTPAGGDMGAHVWGPAYLRDQLLPNGQIAGWTKDWYAGFPAYQFYMVVPSLAIVLLNAGIHGPLSVFPAAAAVGLALLAWARRDQRTTRNLAIAGAVVCFALVGLPYGIAFKLVTVSGVLTLPVCCYAFGRLARLDFPTPAVLAVASVPFLFYRGFTIYGGNIPSTLAGEFAFSMALSLAVVYVGMVMRGLETGRHRGWTAVLLALTGLCHLIVAFWAIGATVIVILVRFNRSRAPLAPNALLAVGGGILAVAGLMLGAPETLGGLVILGAGAVAAFVGACQLSESVRWLTPVAVVGGLLSAWWVGPFYLRRAYLNDMGWEKLPYADQTIWQHLFPSKTPDVDLRWAFALAAVGGVVAIVLRIRAGVFLLLCTLAFGVAFVFAPEGRLWNGRLLPFYYLTALLLAGLGVAELVRYIVARVKAGRPAGIRAGTATALGILACALVYVALPLGALPFVEREATGFAWPSFSPAKVHAGPESFISSWAKWNYTGYEGKDSYREYHDVVQTMAQLGEDQGCGRAFWEYEEELDRYGTPMALMLLPFWTDGCIGSMEGLYFEASATTPFHFLTQVELSTKPSAAQRDLPYGTFDITKGIEHLQLLGVRYYMATSDQAVAAARQQPDLTEVASSPPWVVFEVAGSDLVEPLDNEPAVLEGVHDNQQEWVEEPIDVNGRFGGPAITWFNDPSRWEVYLAQDGPDDWQRIDPSDAPEVRPEKATDVSNVAEGEESLSFDVDRVGGPILVKSSYFPNWQVSGAEGPYRVAPNLMVVVPTETHVELSYGRTNVEYLSYGLTLLGVLGLVLLARRGAYAFTPPPPPSRRRRPAPAADDGEGDGDSEYPGDGYGSRGEYAGDGDGDAGFNGDGGYEYVDDEETGVGTMQAEPPPDRPEIER